MKKNKILAFILISILATSCYKQKPCRCGEVVDRYIVYGGYRLVVKPEGCDTVVRKPIKYVYDKTFVGDTHCGSN